MAAKKPVPVYLGTAGRLGYAAKGTIYFLIGLLTAAFAVRAIRQPTDTEGVFLAVLAQPFGTVLTGLLGIGLIAYAAWRMSQGVFDAEGKGNEARGILIRIGYACSGIVHGALAWSALKLAYGFRRDHTDFEREGTLALLKLPFGDWLIGAAGCVLIAFGTFQCYQGSSYKCRRSLLLGKMSERQISFACRTAQLGLTARGAVFCMIGWFFLTAAREHDSTEVGGLTTALSVIDEQPFGPALLGLIAVGFSAYGLYMFVESYYHRINVR